MKRFFLPLLFAGIALSSCSPRISTVINKPYPPTRSIDPLVIYNSEDNIFPANTEVLGTITTEDTWLIRSDSTTLFDRTVDEVKRVGGNAFLITEHKKRLRASDNISGMILRVPTEEEDDFVPPDNFLLMDSQGEIIYREYAPISARFRVHADVGVGFRTSGISELLSVLHKEYFKGVKSGLATNVGLTYYFDKTWGIRLNWTTHTATSEGYGVNIYDVRFEDIKTTDRLMYIGPSFVVNGTSVNGKWFYNFSLGAGYISSRSESKFQGMKGTMEGGSVAFMGAFEVDWKFSKYVGIGINVSDTFGRIAELTVKKNGTERDGGKLKVREKLNNISASAGIRVYF